MSEELEQTLAATGGSGPGAAPSLARSESVGRYVLLDTLGAGGMGVVFAAYDPSLNRKVALKLLRRPTFADSNTTEGRARLLREAQAMAQLQHPNVVAVHDVGEHEGSIFIAMEFIEGSTLRAWLKDTDRSTSEILTAFVAAGSGLAAAHLKGFVHRDFKPDNVMVGSDGRVRVMDFGLASGQFDAPLDPLSEERDASDLDVTGETLERLTRDGRIMGTPVYMAPEQHLARPTDARSDQFSFCVALYEALYGERPFAGDSVVELAVSVSEGALRSAPAGRPVPSWVRRILVRGLATDPTARFESMDALLAALADDPVVKRRRRLQVLGLIGLVGLAGFALTRDPPPAPAAPPVCQGAREKLAGVWDQDTRDALRSAILATDRSHAPATWERVEPAIDQYVEHWVEQRTEACEATRIHQEQSPEILDERMACYDDHLRNVDALVVVLSEADAAVVDRAVKAVAALPRLNECRNSERLRSLATMRPDPAQEEQFSALGDRLARVHALFVAAKFDDAIHAFQGLVEEIEDLGYAPLLYKALLLRSDLSFRTGHYERCIETNRRMHALAIEYRWHELAGRTANEMASVLQDPLGRAEEARWWDAHAEAWIAGVSDPDTRRRMQSQQMRNRGTFAFAQGNYAEARRFTERALELIVEVDGSEVRVASGPLLHLANIAYELGELDRANEYYAQALAMDERFLGSNHPDVGAALLGWGAALAQAGRLDDARGKYEQALAIYEEVQGPEHVNIANVLNNLGNVAKKEGRLEDALRIHRRALAMREALLGEDHVVLAPSLFNLGEVLDAQGRHAGACEMFERALVVTERGSGEDHPHVARVLTGLSKPLRALGEVEQANRHLERARTIYEKTLGPEHPELGTLLMVQGSALYDSGRVAESVAPRERALSIILATPQSAPLLAEARWSLSLSLWNAPESSGRDRVRARALMTRARADLADASPDHEMLAKLDRWIDEHPP